MKLIRFGSFLSRKKRINAYFRLHKVRKLQIGCGANILEGWINTDYTPLNKNVMFINATKKLPFGINSIDYIYTEHMIEHICYTDGQRFLEECCRILKPGGKIRIATPDLKFLIELYNREKQGVLDEYMHWVIDKYSDNTDHYSDTFVINNFFYNFGHKFIYDFKTLKYLLDQQGFVNCGEYDIRESDDENLRGLESHGTVISDDFNKLETFVIQAVKQ